MADGSTVEGIRPPEGEPVYLEDYDFGARIIDVRYVAMPDDAACSRVCIRRLDTEHVELASGSPMILGHFDELPTTGAGSELRRHLADDDPLTVAVQQSRATPSPHR